MSKVDDLRTAVTQRLAAAAEEILGLFGRTMAECEEELYLSKQENERQRKLLDAVLNPEVCLHRADSKSMRSNEEEEQLCSSHGGGHKPESTKSKDEKVQSSQFHQSQITASSSTHQMESDRNEKGYEVSAQVNGPSDGDETPELEEQTEQPSREPEPAVMVVQTGISDDGTSDSSEPQGESDDVKQEESVKPQTKLKRQKSNGVSSVHKKRNSQKKSIRCLDCRKIFHPDNCVQSHTNNAPGSNQQLCSVCVQRSTKTARVLTLKKGRTDKNTFRCSVCRKQFSFKGDAVRHIRIHTGERPFRCSVCGHGFAQSTGLRQHMRTHTKEKPFTCSVCSRCFITRGCLARHSRVHTGEKPYSCTECNKSFNLSQSLLKHMMIHTGEKPFSCSVCDQRFTQKVHMKQHMTLHTGEKSFSCPVSKKKFTRRSGVRIHKCITERSSRD
ncbi:uncharacterized protein LOC141796356 [Halichoeres trimaculatus]|uniref:uncharacterized protein LOC141796356 n=1 Tax=Halichoeres trimaculatus TaxID=147232 RepID=UPI003D9F34D7